MRSSHAGLPLSGLSLPPSSFSSSSLRFLPLLLHTLSSKDPHCFGTQTKDSYNRLCLATLLDTKVTNPMEYEFKFQLEIRGPCLLAGKREMPQAHTERERRPEERDRVPGLKSPERCGRGQSVGRPPNQIKVRGQAEPLSWLGKLS